MVLSRIQKTIEYKEQKGIYAEDIGFNSPIFHIFFHKNKSENVSLLRQNEVSGIRKLGNVLSGQLIEITLGKLKYNYMNHNIVYYPIYLVTKQVSSGASLSREKSERSRTSNEVKYQIGVFELNAKDSIKTNVEDLENPLWYSFAAQIVEDYYPEKRMVPSTNIGDDFDEQGNISVLDTNHHPMEIRQDGIFTIELHRHEVILPVETKEEADGIVRKYMNSKNINISWVEQFFKNTHYKIHDVEDNGDSLFAVIRDAFQQIGYETTVAKLRTLVATHATQQHYEYYKEKHNCMKRFLERYEKKTTTRRTTTNTANNIQTKKLWMILKLHLGSMIPINALETIKSFHQHLQKSTFYADEFIIILLERLLKIKFIFLSELAHHSKTPYDVLECHHDIIECRQEATFQPERYILVVHEATKNHYQLCSYKSKTIFLFKELPYHIKNMIQIRVSENNAGIFPCIKEFQEFQRSIGVKPLSTTECSAYISNPNNLIRPGATYIEEQSCGLQHEGIIFTFHGKSRCSAKPGKGSFESIPICKCIDYITLDRIPYWRQKLDDSWIDIENPIVIDGKSYASVQHYMEAAKYKHESPEVAIQFSLESNSEISKDFHLLHNRVKPVNEPKLIIDKGFQSRYDHEYRKALQEKFAKTEMRRILLETKPALLQRYVPRKLPKVAEELMDLRKSF